MEISPLASNNTKSPDKIIKKLKTSTIMEGKEAQALDNFFTSNLTTCTVSSPRINIEKASGTSTPKAFIQKEVIQESEIEMDSDTEEEEEEELDEDKVLKGM